MTRMISQTQVVMAEAEGTDLANTQYRAALREKVATFDPDNPLDLDATSQFFFRYTVPLFLLFTSIGTAFSWRVLRSRWIRFLVSTPGLEQMTILMAVLNLIGPGYVWIIQQGGCVIMTSQVYPCFLYQWMHNMLLIANSWTLAALLTERTFTIFSAETSWHKLQGRMRTTCRAIMTISGFVSGLGLVVSDNVPSPEYSYSVCVPWWSNEFITNCFTWYWLFSFMFAILPALTILILIITLSLSLAKFRKMLRSRVDDLDHYSGLLLELCTKSSNKFCTSIQGLGILFLFTYLPLGIFIILGPSMSDKMVVQPAGNQTLATSNGPPIYKVNFNISFTGVTRSSDKNLEKQTLSKTKPKLPGNTVTTPSSVDLGDGLDLNLTVIQLIEKLKSQRRHDKAYVKPGELTASNDKRNSHLSRKTRAATENVVLSNYVDNSYVINLSRTRLEILMWMLCYAFSGLFTPLLLATEVLFRREAMGRIEQMKNKTRVFRKTVPVPLNDVDSSKDDITTTSFGISKSAGGAKANLQNPVSCTMIKSDTTDITVEDKKPELSSTSVAMQPVSRPRRTRFVGVNRRAEEKQQQSMSERENGEETVRMEERDPERKGERERGRVVDRSFYQPTPFQLAINQQ